MKAIVTDHRTLRGMETQGFIVRLGTPRTRTKHWSGLYVKEYRVKPGERFTHCDWRQDFKYRGKTYRIQYFDGSFHPFVVEVGKPLPHFV